MPRRYDFEMTKILRLSTENIEEGAVAFTVRLAISNVKVFLNIPASNIDDGMLLRRIPLLRRMSSLRSDGHKQIDLWNDLRGRRLKIKVLLALRLKIED